jgi:hypothetical protein
LLSRRTRFSLQLLLAALALSVGAAGAGGCSSETTDSVAATGTTAPPIDDPPAGPATNIAPDATVDTVPYHGNPLCHMAVGDSTCSPDEDEYRFLIGQCEKPAADAGDAASNGIPAGACRIVRGDGGVSATCSQEDTTTGGGDGATCKGGSDCAPGFDCVVGENGANTCRHYCCAGTCKGRLSQNSGGTFCDVQSLVDVNQKAPVCMPVKQCKLLGSGECAANESCAVVTESGDTGCVTVGEQQAGASCDTDHCAANLSCLGEPGSRKCYKLCKVNSADCTGLQVCETSTLFKDPTFGTCQTPTPSP